MTVEIPIFWGDEDSFAHVNNVVYLRWCEQSRVAYLRRIGLLPESPPHGIGPIVVSVACQYRAQLNYPDTVIAGTRVASIGNSSFRMVHLIVSRGTGKVAAEAETTIVAFDYATGSSVRVPDAVREAIGHLEETAR